MPGHKTKTIDDLNARRLRTPWASAAGLVTLAAVLSACTANANDTVNPAGTYVAGFWPGLWEGIIAPIAFIVSLFNDKVGIYEIHNSGGWYNFGFMVGLSISMGAPARAGASAAKSRKEK